MDSTRRSFFGLLGGVAALGAGASVALAAPPLAGGTPLRIDEWDEGGVRRFHIETDDDVDLGVFFWVSGEHRKGALGTDGRVYVDNPRQVLIPLVKDDVNEFGAARRVASVRKLADAGKPVVHVTHLRKATGVEVSGIAVLPRLVTVDDMRLLVPARLTVARA